ncbi:MAG TPA: hypothetical protein VLB68_14610 [Pyrinomonadaceae bacterium]|nr:hypothetical protein [Pyrinomonadaceae bacterium]
MFALTAGPSIARRSTNSDFAHKNVWKAGEGFIAQAYESANHVIGVGPFLALSLWNKETTQPMRRKEMAIRDIGQMYFSEVNRIVSRRKNS